MRPEDLVRPEILALKAYPVPSSDGMVKLDAMENPYPLPDSMKRELAAAPYGEGARSSEEERGNDHRDHGPAPGRWR